LRTFPPRKVRRLAGRDPPVLIVAGKEYVAVRGRDPAVSGKVTAARRVDLMEVFINRPEVVIWLADNGAGGEGQEQAGEIGIEADGAGSDDFVGIN